MEFGLTWAKLDEMQYVTEAEKLGFTHLWTTDSPLIRSDAFVFLTAAALQTKLHAVEVGYKADIAALQTNGDNTILLLREIRQDIKQVADKLDRKAEK